MAVDGTLFDIFLQDVVIHILIHSAIDKMYVAHFSGRYTSPNHYIFIIVSSISFHPQPRDSIRAEFSFHLTKLRLSKISDPYPDVLLQIKRFLLLTKGLFGLLDHESHTYATHGELFGYS